MIYGILILNRLGQIRLKKVYDDNLWELLENTNIVDDSHDNKPFLQELQQKVVMKYAAQNKKVSEQSEGLQGNTQQIV